MKSKIHEASRKETFDDGVRSFCFFSTLGWNEVTELGKQEHVYCRGRNQSGQDGFYSKEAFLRPSAGPWSEVMAYEFGDEKSNDVYCESIEKGIGLHQQLETFDFSDILTFGRLEDHLFSRRK